MFTDMRCPSLTILALIESFNRNPRVILWDRDVVEEFAKVLVSVTKALVVLEIAKVVSPWGCKKYTASPADKATEITTADARMI
jgi:hypothetical protein